MKYQFIEQYKQEFPVVVMCRVLEVSESDIYARRQQRVAARRASLHQFFDELKQGQACQRCGIADPRLLEFRYQDENGKAGNLKNKAITMNWSIRCILQEVEKCQLLCWNCRKLQAEREE